MKNNAITQELENKLESMRKDPCKITPEAIDSLWEPAKQASAAVSAAMQEYEKDLQTRQTAIDKQVSELEATISTLTAQIDALEEKSRDAASRGDLDTAADFDEQAETVRKDLSIAQRKRRIATGAELKGDPSLFDAVKAARTHYNEACTSSREFVCEAVSIVAEWAEFFESLHKKTMWKADYCPSMDSYKYEKIEHHFHADLFARIEKAGVKKEREQKGPVDKDAVIIA